MKPDEYDAGRAGVDEGLADEVGVMWRHPHLIGGTTEEGALILARPPAEELGVEHQREGGDYALVLPRVDHHDSVRPGADGVSPVGRHPDDPLEEPVGNFDTGH